MDTVMLHMLSVNGKALRYFDASASDDVRNKAIVK